MELLLSIYISAQLTAGRARSRIIGRLASDERGEGVISAAIAVLVMAVLGAAMFAAFKGVFDSASNKAKTAVDQIGG